MPEEKQQAFHTPPKKMRRVKGTHQLDFLRACKDGHKPSSNFDEYAGPLNEIVLLGCLAIKAGVGKRVEWDSVKMTCPNFPELDRLISREHRKGWEVG